MPSTTPIALTPSYRPARRRTGTAVWLTVLALLCVVATTVIGPVGGVATASAATTGAPVKGVGSGRCLDVLHVSKQPGTGVDIWDCNNQVNQTWTATSAGELKVYDAATCLDVAGSDVTAPARLQIAACTGAANQKWKLNTDGTITGVQSGLCLDVTSYQTAAGSEVGLWTCTGGLNQKWTTKLTGADSTPPSVPADPQATALTCNSVHFGWNASSDNVGVRAYDVFHDGQLISTVSGSTLSADLKVVAGVRWGLYVNARDEAGNVSQASSTVFITPPQCQTDSQPPTTPGTPTATVSGTTVTLTWGASSDNVGVRTYEIYRSSAGTSGSQVATKVGTVTGTASAPPVAGFVDSGLAARTGYSYTVSARDAQGNASARSTAVSVVTGAACGDAVCGVSTVTTDTDIPWGLLTLPDGSVLYSRRDAHTIVRLDPKTGTKTTVGTVPNVDETDGEGGLLGLAVAPTFSSDRWLYVMHTSPSDNRIVRIKLSATTGAMSLDLSSEQVLLSGILRNKFHNGGRLRFGPDGKLYASTGDAQNGDNAQNLNGLNGKVLRLDPDGGVPSDNPFGNYVWSYGHRNPQGLAFDSRGRLWEQEFGNGVMDETNLIVRGGNYGWPSCEGTSGSCAEPGLCRARAHLPGERRILFRHRDRPGRALRRLRTRAADVSRGDLRQQPDRRHRAVRRHLRPAAHRGTGPGRRPLADHHQPGRQGQHRRQQQREDPARHARQLGSPARPGHGCPVRAGSRGRVLEAGGRRARHGSGSGVAPRGRMGPP